jgi:hypothetical protein
MNDRRPLAAFMVLGALAACSGGGSNGAQDAAIGTDGAMSGDAGGSVGSDASSQDSGVAGICNPYDGTGCDSIKFCVWKITDDVLQCRILDMVMVLEESCDQGLLNCAPGLACGYLQGDAGPRCYKICDPRTGMGCDGLMGMSASYQCTGLMNAQGQATTYGVCLGAGMVCDPLMDTCAMNETCTPTQHGAACAPSGPTTKGGDCTSMACVKGLVCIPLAGAPNPICYQPCNPAMTNTCPTMGDVCVGLSGFTFGVCRTPRHECDPLMDACPMGQVCTYSNGDLTCQAEGPVAIGGDCSMQACARGGVCVFVSGTAHAICYQPCDATMPARVPCPMGTTCSTIGQSFGICTM